MQINLGRVRTLRAIAFTILFLALVAGFVYAAVTASDTATRVIGIVLAVLAGIPLLLVLLSLPRLTRPSVLRFDDRGIAYSYDGASTVVPWTDISAVGIAFEIPVDIPSIDLSGILADKLVYDVLKVNKSRKISLEIFPALPETLNHHPVLANYRQNLRPPKEGLGTGIWRMPFPSPRLARRVAQGPQKYAPSSTWAGTGDPGAAASSAASTASPDPPPDPASRLHGGARDSWLTSKLVVTNLPGVSPSRMRAEDRRELVLVAARVEFGRHGFEAATTEAIAKRVGVSQPYLFRLFPSKKAIFLECIERCFDQISAMFDEAAGDQTGEAALMAMGRAYNALLDDRPVLQMQLHMWAAACADDEVRKVARRRMAQLWQQAERISGADAQRVMQFIASGMLLNVFAAMELPRIKEQLGEALTGLTRSP